LEFLFCVRYKIICGRLFSRTVWEDFLAEPTKPKTMEGLKTRINHSHDLRSMRTSALLPLHHKNLKACLSADFIYICRRSLIIFF
jgi:hypothetical protein